MPKNLMAKVIGARSFIMNTYCSSGTDGPQGLGLLGTRGSTEGKEENAQLLSDVISVLTNIQSTQLQYLVLQALILMMGLCTYLVARWIDGLRCSLPLQKPTQLGKVGLFELLLQRSEPGGSNGGVKGTTQLLRPQLYLSQRFVVKGQFLGLEILELMRHAGL